MQLFKLFKVFGFFTTFLYGVLGQLDIEELLSAQQRLNGRGGSGMGSMIGNTIRRSFINTALTQAVKFIVGQEANLSPELMQFGMTVRSAPRNQEERNTYLEYMKVIARRTPEVMMKYLKTEKLKNGTDSHSIDFIAMDADLTRRSLLYQEMRSARRQERQLEQERAQQHQLEVSRLHALQDVRMNRQFDLGITSPFLSGGLGPTTSMFDFNLFGGFGAAPTTVLPPLDLGSATQQQAQTAK